MDTHTHVYSKNTHVCICHKVIQGAVKRNIIEKQAGKGEERGVSINKDPRDVHGQNYIRQLGKYCQSL